MKRPKISPITTSSNFFFQAFKEPRRFISVSMVRLLVDDPAPASQIKTRQQPSSSRAPGGLPRFRMDHFQPGFAAQHTQAMAGENVIVMAQGQVLERPAF